MSLGVWASSTFALVVTAALLADGKNNVLMGSVLVLASAITLRGPR